MFYIYSASLIFVVIGILFQILDIIKIRNSMRWFIQHTQSSDNFKECNIEPVPILLLLPMYKEAEICGETISYFSNLEYNPAFLKIVIICSGRELNSIITNDINNALSNIETLKQLKQHWPSSLTHHFSIAMLNRMAMCSKGCLFIFRQKLYSHIAPPDTTIYEIEQAISNLDNKSKVELFMHIVTDGSDRFKPDQLNYFIDHKDLCLEKQWQSNSTYLGIFDSDARPDKRCLWAVAQQVQKNKALVMQLIPLFFRNVFSEKYSLSNFYTGTRSLFNTQFCLSYELPAMRASCKAGTLPLIWSGTQLHLFGSGEFIRYDLIEKIGFHNPSADTLFGYLCSYGNIPIFPIPLINLGETPETVKKLFYQGIVWFNGVSGQAKVARSKVVSLGFRPSVLRNLIIRYRRTFYNLSWWLFPHIVFLIIIVSLILKWLDLLFALSTLIILCTFNYILAIKFVSICKRYSIFNSDILIPSLSIIQILIMLMLWPFERLMATTSPIIYYFMYFFSHDIPLKKTERKSAAQKQERQQ